MSRVGVRVAFTATFPDEAARDRFIDNLNLFLGSQGQVPAVDTFDTAELLGGPWVAPPGGRRMSGGKVLVAQPRPHVHDFPLPADEAVENDVVTCGGCGGVFVARTGTGSDIYTHWRPLHWWHFRARRLLRAAPPSPSTNSPREPG